MRFIKSLLAQGFAVRYIAYPDARAMEENRGRNRPGLTSFGETPREEVSVGACGRAVLALAPIPERALGAARPRLTGVAA
ncbi:MAG TPA: hypothetical protein VGM81_21465 [Burkholderiaceae bacterium]|jgi:hypothetical protein